MDDNRYTVVVETSYRPGQDLPNNYHIVRSGLTADEADDLEIKLNDRDPPQVWSFEFDDYVWPTETVIVVTDEEAATGRFRRAS